LTRAQIKYRLAYKRNRFFRQPSVLLSLECPCGQRFHGFHSEQLERALVKHIEACHPWAE